MSETAAATEQTPVIMWNGHPWSPQMAETRRNELMANAEYVKAALGGDEEKQGELRDLYMIQRGMTPGASLRPPENVDDVIARMTETEIRRELQREASWRDRVAPSTPQEMAEFERGEATTSQKHAARQFIERAKSDPSFRAKLLSGDMQARSHWDRAHFVLNVCDEIPDPEAHANG